MNCIFPVIQNVSRYDLTMSTRFPISCWVCSVQASHVIITWDLDYNLFGSFQAHDWPWVGQAEQIYRVPSVLVRPSLPNSHTHTHTHTHTQPHMKSLAKLQSWWVVRYGLIYQVLETEAFHMETCISRWLWNCHLETCAAIRMCQQSFPSWSPSNTLRILSRFRLENVSQQRLHYFRFSDRCFVCN